MEIIGYNDGLAHAYFDPKALSPCGASAGIAGILYDTDFAEMHLNAAEAIRSEAVISPDAMEKEWHSKAAPLHIII